MLESFLNVSKSFLTLHHLGSAWGSMLDDFIISLKKSRIYLSNGVRTRVYNTNENISYQDSLSNVTLAGIKGTEILRCSYHFGHQATSKRGTAFKKVTGSDME